MPAWRGLAASAGIALAALVPARAPAALEPGSGPLRGSSAPCVITSVKEVAPRLVTAGQTTYTAANFQQSGVVVAFNTHLGLGPGFAGETATVTHYQGATGNPTMMRERAGDRVQVCFLGGPKHDQYCDPSKDDRGRWYRVYDYRQNAAYTGMNGEHDCGGA